MREIHNIVNKKMNEIERAESLHDAAKAYYYALGCVDYARANDEIDEERHYFMKGHLETAYKNVSEMIHSNNIDQSLNLNRENNSKMKNARKTVKITRIC